MRKRFFVPAAAGILVAALTAGPSLARTDGVLAGPEPYIVVLKDSVANPSAVSNDHLSASGIRANFVYQHALKGYAANLPAALVERIKQDPRVDSIVPDGVATISTTQFGPPWGLDRIDQRNLPLSNSYTYTNTGLAVKAYIIDTGIRVTHNDFGGRAIHGRDTIDNDNVANDCHGHGTHVAGTVGGTTFGVAKLVTLVAVRVLDCRGSGSWSQVIAGVDWVTNDHLAGQPAVANMSLGGGFNSAVNAAVKQSIRDGVRYNLAAGNESTDACTRSPASVKGALTVAASSSSDGWASFSNYGSCVDLIAPGVGVLSAWYTSDTATQTLSGTSMAAPHVAGVGAQLLQSNPLATNKQYNSGIKKAATRNVISGVPGLTPNKLLFTNR